MQVESLLEDLGWVPLSEKTPIFNENPPIVGRPRNSGARRTFYGNYAGRNQRKHNPHKLHDVLVLTRIADRVLEIAKKSVVGGVGWSCGMRCSRAWCATPLILGVVNMAGTRGLSHVTWVHYDATMWLPCLVCSILPFLHFLRFDLFVL